VVVENKALYGSKGEVPTPPQIIPIGEAAVVRRGHDITIVSYGAAVSTAMAAAVRLAAEGIDAEVLDLRSIQPWDEAAVLRSLALTHHLVVVHEAVEAFGVGAEIVARMAEIGFYELDGPIVRVGAPFMPVPFSRELERQYLPNADAVVRAAQKTLE
jgi:pyruvate dehydrogenase E1 component beta subunit